MKMTDLRRLTGSNLVIDGPGAGAEVKLPPGREGIVLALWRKQARQLLDQVGWTGERAAARLHAGGASLAIGAPLDGLDAAVDLLEISWEATEASLAGEPDPMSTTAAETFAGQIRQECNPRLVALAQAAADKGISFLHGEDKVSLGLGQGCQTWPDSDPPAVELLDWSRFHDVPIALVTGTNGKSTTVRLTAAIGDAAGRTVGLCSSDWVRVGGEIIDEGDYSGPGGARRAVRDRRVDLAALEVARGGLLRRGLSIPRAGACVITNVAVDHMGEYGVTDLATLTEAKFIVSRAVKDGGRLVLNADDPSLVARSTGFAGDITWFSLEPRPDWLPAWRRAGGHAVVVDDDHVVLARGGEAIKVVPVERIPIAMGGAARFNLANALAAVALASALDLPVDAMAQGLAEFQGGPKQNPGRGNFIDLGGVTLLVDFAHNPHGVSALMTTVQQLPAKRRLVLLGQAGDRRDDDIRALVQTVWQSKPDRIIVKEMLSTLRGRTAGEVPDLMIDELRALDVPKDAIGRAESEIDAVHQALAWARSGDLLVLLLHAERKAALRLIGELEDRGWCPGDAIEV